MTFPFTLPQLSYSYDALEPYIDAKTMEIHHLKHHQAYIDNLNTALKDHVEFHARDLDWILQNISLLPVAIQQIVINNGGGHYNHSEFWRFLTPASKGLIAGKLQDQLVRDFGSFDQFKNAFNLAAKSRFGSGWAWLSLDKEERLVVSSTANQDSLISNGFRPILGLDVWEHAYYLKYQNRRVDYIDAWWHVINWDYVQDQFNSLT